MNKSSKKGKENIINNKKILNIVTLCILIIIPILKVCSMYLEKYGLLINAGLINCGVVFYVALPFLIYIYISDIKNGKHKLDIYDYLTYALIIAGILSTIFAIYPSIAILGKLSRREGFIAILSYMFLLNDWRINFEKEDIEKNIKVFTIIGVINAIYGILQVYFTNDLLLLPDVYRKVATGLCGHENFFGTLMLIVLSIYTLKYLIYDDNRKNIILVILFWTLLINAQSTGPFLSYIVFMIFFIIYLKRKNIFNFKKFIILFEILIITYSCVTVTDLVMHEINLSKDKDYRYKQIQTEFTMKKLSSTLTGGGNGRIFIWTKSMDIVKNNFWFGVGYDNFQYAFPNPNDSVMLSLSATDISSKPVETKYVHYDNAHNVYLHTLVSTGIFGLIPYLLICLYTFIRGLKTNNKEIIILLGAFVSYSVQAFVNLSVINVAPIYYIIIGLILGCSDKERNML